MRSTSHRNPLGLLAVVAAAALLIAACGGEGDGVASTVPPAANDAARELEGSWIAVGGTIQGDAITLLDDGPITIEIDDGSSVRGRAACNSYGGDAVFGSGGELSFGDISITEMGCLDDGLMELEALYVGTLAGLDGWTLDDEVLVLTGGGAEWRFEPERPLPTVDAFAVTWVLESRIEGDVASNAVGFDAVVLRLAADETFEGATGCSGLSGRWEERGDDAGIAAIEVAPESGGCSESAQALESFVVAVLERSPDLVIDDDLLTVETVDGDALVFRAVPDEDPDESADEPTEPVGLSSVSVRPVLACGEESLTVEADIVQVDPAQQLDCALGPPISDASVFAADAEAVPAPTGQWQVSVRIAEGARGDWDAAATECFEQGPGCPTGQLAIVANGAIASAPMVQTPTFPGEIVISGTFTESDARSIAASINANG